MPPKTPTQEEIWRHRANGHYPYRSWCKCCVSGRRRDDPHTRGDEKEREAEFHVDYFFPRDRPGGPSTTCLAMKHRRTKFINAYNVPTKGGSDDWIVKKIERDVRRLGKHGCVLFKSDGEHSIGDLLNEVARLRGNAGTVVELSPKGSSQSNGVAERCVQQVEESVRVTLLDLEDATGYKVSVEDPIFAWLVMYAADVINKGLVGEDGKTAWQRVRGRSYGGKGLPFGYPIMHRLTGDVAGGDLRGRWAEGIYLGRLFLTDEAIVGTPEGVVIRARTVTPRPEGTRVNEEMLKAIRTRPWENIGTLGQGERPHGDVPRASTMPAEKEQKCIPRDFRITDGMIGKYGTSDKCPRCAAIRRGRDDGRSRHSAVCRERIKKLLAEDGDMNEVVSRAEMRRNQYLAEEVERLVNEKEGKPDAGEGMGDGDVDSKEFQEWWDRKRELVDHQTAESSRGARPSKKARADVAEEDSLGDGGGLSNSSSSNNNSSSNRSSSSSSSSKSDADQEEEQEPPRKKSRKQELQALQGEDRNFEVCEIFTPPRVTKRLKDRPGSDLRAGWSVDKHYVDPVTGRSYDLTNRRDQREVKRMLRRDKPLMLIASPSCALVSVATLTGGPTEVETAQAQEMLRFAMELCEVQRRDGRDYIFELPQSARSWQDPSIMEFAMRTRAGTVTFDQCCFGQVATDLLGIAPVYEPTTFMTNAGPVLESFDRRCEGGHRHVQLVGAQARAAAKCPDLMCDEIIKAVEVIAHFEKELHMFGFDSEICQESSDKTDGDEESGWDEGFGEIYYDAISQEWLDPALVQAGRKEEIEYMENIEAWTLEKKTTVLARNPQAKLVKTKWVDTNKGTSADPQVRCRLVAMEFNDERRDDLFAGTPPLTGLRYLLSDTMS